MYYYIVVYGQSNKFTVYFFKGKVQKYRILQKVQEVEIILRTSCCHPYDELL